MAMTTVVNFGRNFAINTRTDSNGKNTLHIEDIVARNGEAVEVKIGNLIWNATVTGGRTVLDISKLPSGTYYVYVSGKEIPTPISV